MKLSADELAAFVASSCERCGVPIKVTDGAVLKVVATLLGGSGRPAAPAAGG